MATNKDESIGFPPIDSRQADLTTRPMGLHEMPKLAQIDREMAIVRRHHERIANAIDTFWGHRDCVEYIEKLILSGGDASGKTRVGFKAEVVAALINLTNLHEVTYR